MTPIRHSLEQEARARMQWWAAPPEPLRPSPAADPSGWDLATWMQKAGIGSETDEDRFRAQWPSVLRVPDLEALAREAIRQLVAQGWIDPVPGHPGRFRAMAQPPRGLRST